MAGSISLIGYRSCTALLARVAQTGSQPAYYSSHTTSSQTHYDVLGLQRDCSQADIKIAFLQLSKKLHPDVQPSGKDDIQHHLKFVALNQAYQSLSKPGARTLYDASLSYGTRHTYSSGGRHYGVYTNSPYKSADYDGGSRRNHYDAMHDYQRNTTRHYGAPYTKQRYPKHLVFKWVLIFTFVGIVVQYKIIRFVSESAITRLDERDRLLSAVLERDRRRGNELGVLGELKRFEQLSLNTKWMRTGRRAEGPIGNEEADQSRR